MDYIPEEVYLPGFDNFVDNPLASGLWATGLFWTAVYSGLCVHHNRTPLWPTRRLRFKTWASGMVKTTAVATWLFNLVAGAILISIYAADPNAFVLCFLGLLCLLTFWWLVPSGVVSHMLGLHYWKVNRDKKDSDEEHIEKRSTNESWDENLESGPSSLAVVSDIEASKPLAAETRDAVVPVSQSKSYLARVVATLALISVMLHVSIAATCASDDTWNATGWHITSVIVTSVCTLLATGGRTALEFYSHRGSVGGWNMFWRVLAFLVFYFTFITTSVAQSLLQEYTVNEHGGIPFFIIPVRPRGYAFFAGSVVAFLLPLFSF